MEERIQHTIKELEKKYSIFNPEYFKTKPRTRPTYDALREEAVQIIEKELAQEEKQKKHMQEQREERVRIEQSWKETQEKQARLKKEEEEREQLKVLQEREDPDKPLTIKDIRAIPGFYYNDYNRALEELNVEILKRIARKTYPHKFDIKVNAYDTHGNQKILSNVPVPLYE
jgi:hypothetical protein